MEVRTMRAALIAIICILIPAAVVSAAPILDQEARKRIDGLVTQAIEAHSTPSACVVIGTKDGIIYAKAYGHLTYEADSPPATLDTIYDMASCSKAVGTTSTAMMLIQDGKLSLDDRVSKYLPDWNRDDRRDVTIRHLITHTSGLPSYCNRDKVEAARKPGESHPDALIRYIAELPLGYETGNGHLYACLNFLTLARVNEEAAGVCQETFLRRHLFVPLGMLNSGYYLSDKKKPMAAPTVGGEHFRQGRVHDPLAAYYCTGYRCSGNAGFFSTANDLSKFCRMMLSDGVYNGHRIFAPETIDLFATNQLPEDVRGRQGMGWGGYSRFPYATELNKDARSGVFGHAGYTGTFMRFDRLAGTFVIVLTNRVYPDDTGSNSGIVRAVLQSVVDEDPIYKGVPRPAPRPQTPPKTEEGDTS